jgi:hypothetical protein
MPKKKNKKAKKIKKLKKKIKEIASAEVPSEEDKKDFSEEGKKEETLEDQVEEGTVINPPKDIRAIEIEAPVLEEVAQGEQETFILEDQVGNAPIQTTEDLPIEESYQVQQPNYDTTKGEYLIQEENPAERVVGGADHADIESLGREHGHVQTQTMRINPQLPEEDNRGFYVTERTQKVDIEKVDTNPFKKRDAKYEGKRFR